MGQTPEGKEKANVKLSRIYRDDPPKRRERDVWYGRRRVEFISR
jgi:hypothetical protein